MTEREIISRADAKARGLKRYFTGKPCKHGHVAERLTESARCYECSKQASKLYMAAHPDRSRDAHKRWATKNPEKARAAAARYYENNKEQINKDKYQRGKDNPLRKVRNRAASKKKVEALSPSYVAQMLDIPTAQLTPHLLAAKREHLQLHRLHAELRNELEGLTK